MTSDHDPSSLPAAQAPDPSLIPLTFPLRERAAGPGRFEQETGPFATYERTARRGPDGAIENRVSGHLDLPVWAPLFARPVARLIRRAAPLPPTQRPREAWWLPPEVLNRRVTRLLGVFGAVSLVLGYNGFLLSQTNTYLRSDLGLSASQMGVILAAVRAAGIGVLAVGVAADRWGRARLIHWGGIGSLVFTVLSGVAPDPVTFTIAQVIARGMSGGVAVVLGAAAVEETPARSRAYATSVLAFAAGPGGSLVLLGLQVADRWSWGWRVLYVVPPLLALVPFARASAKLPETHRFEAGRSAGRAVIDRAGRRLLRRRLIVFAVATSLSSAFATPYGNGFNDHLRRDRGFDSTGIGLFQTITNTPFALGVIVGGRLADRYGRRPVGAASLAAAAILNSAQFHFSGLTFWFLSSLGSFAAGPWLPTLGVTSSESFPTSRRGSSNGLLTIASVCGSVAGLLLAGPLTDRYGFPVAMTVLAAAPLLTALVVALWYPEGAGVELEHLNPGEASATDGPAPAA